MAETQSDLLSDEKLVFVKLRLIMFKCWKPNQTSNVLPTQSSSNVLPTQSSSNVLPTQNQTSNVLPTQNQTSNVFSTQGKIQLWNTENLERFQLFFQIS